MAIPGSNPLDQRPIIHKSAIHDIAEALSDEQDMFGPESMGRYLRQIRMQRGISVRDVSNQIRIRINQVEALEDGRVEDLPGLVYSIGYVRSYANLLGLDGEEAVRRFKSDTPSIDASDLSFPEQPRPQSSLPRPVTVLFALIIGGISYGGWLFYGHKADAPQIAEVPSYLAPVLEKGTVGALKPQPEAAISASTSNSVRLSSRTPSLNETPMMQKSPTEYAGTMEQIPALTETDFASARSDAVGRIVGSAEEELVAQPEMADISIVPGNPLQNGRGSPISAVLNSAETLAENMQANEAHGAESSPARSARLITPIAPVVPSVLAAVSAAEAAVNTGTGQRLGQMVDSRITIRAKTDSFVQVTDANDNLFLQRVLRAGDVYHVPDQKGLKMITGNAGGLVILVDDQQISSLGKSGQILQGVALEPGQILGATVN